MVSMIFFLSCLVVVHAGFMFLLVLHDRDSGGGGCRDGDGGGKIVGKR